MKKILLSTLVALIGASSLSAQINTNAFDLSASSGDLKIRRYDNGDLVWKNALTPMGDKLFINYADSEKNQKVKEFMFKYSDAFIANNKKDMFEIIFTKNILEQIATNTNLTEFKNGKTGQ